MARELQSRVVILADDRTGSAFSSVASKLKALSSSSKQVKAVTTQVQAVQNAMAGFDKSGDKLGKIQVFRDAARQAIELGKTHREALTSLRAVGREMNQIGPPTRALVDRYRQVKDQVRETGRALSEQKAAVSTAKQSLQAAGINVDRLATAQRRLEQATRSATAAARDQGGQVARHTQRLAAATARHSPLAHVPGAIGGGVVAYKARDTFKKAVVDAGEFDYAKRRQQAFADLSEKDQRELLLPQAREIATETKFNNIDVVEAQTTVANRLPGHLKNASTIVPLVAQMKNYALSMKGTTMDDAAQAVTGFLMSTGKDISTKDKADTEARRASNLLIRMSKLGAMSHDDLMPFVQRGVSAGSIAGLSDETMAALAIGMKRSNISGDQAGTALRTLSAKLVAPTDKGLSALATAGIDYSKYAKMPGGLSVDSLEGKFKQDFGKSFTPEIREKLAESLSDSEIVADRGRFTEAVTDAVASLFKANKDGSMRASDRQAVAKKVGQFHKFSVESVDSEGLLQAILERDPSLGVLNAFATDKHGNKIGLIAKAFEQFGRDKQALKETPNDFGDKISATITGGLGGALERLTGSIENAYLSIGTANERWLAPAADKLGNAIDALSNAPPKVIEFTTQVGLAAAALLALRSAAGLASITAAGAGALGVTGAGVGALAAAGRIGSTIAQYGMKGLGWGTLAYGGYQALEYAQANVTTPEGWKYRNDQAVDPGTYERAMRAQRERQRDPEAARGRAMSRTPTIETMAKPPVVPPTADQITALYERAMGAQRERERDPEAARGRAMSRTSTIETMAKATAAPAAAADKSPALYERAMGAQRERQRDPEAARGRAMSRTSTIETMAKATAAPAAAADKSPALYERAMGAQRERQRDPEAARGRAMSRLPAIETMAKPAMAPAPAPEANAGMYERAVRVQRERQRDPEAARGRALSNLPKLEAVVQPDQITSKLEGSATVKLDVNVKLDPKLEAKIDQAISASGHLSAAGSTAVGSTGRTMPEAASSGAP